MGPVNFIIQDASFDQRKT